MIEIVCRSEPGALVLEPVGDLSSAPERMLRTCLDAAIEGGVTTLIVDLARVAAVTPAMEAALEQCGRRIERRGGCLVVREATERSPAATAGMVGSRRETGLGDLSTRGGGLCTSPSSRHLRSEPA
jgi:hypothetical protein